MNINNDMIIGDTIVKDAVKVININKYLNIFFIVLPTLTNIFF
jgi:hypothetical protein